MARLRRLLLAFLLAFVAFSSSGCMTIEHLIDPKQKLKVYGGTKTSYDYIENAGSPRFGVLLRIIDLPFTTVADTLITPITIPLAN